jgi:uncharacterized membrane protein
VLDWLLPTLVNIVGVGAMGVAASRALRTLTWRSLLLTTTGAYLLVTVALVAFGDARFGLDGAWGWALLSGVLTVTGLVSMNLALTEGEASKVIALSAAYPVVTLFLAALVLEEAVTGGRWLGTLLVVVGVALIAVRGGRDALLPHARGSWRWLVPTCVFTGVLGVVGVTSRLALETMTWQDLIAWATLCYTVAAAALLVIARRRGEHLVRANGWGVVAGALAVGSLAALYVALANGEASVVIPVSSAFPIVTLALAWLLLGERLTVPRSVGTTIVVAGVVVITAL